MSAATAGEVMPTASTNKNAEHINSQTPESNVYQTKDNGSWVTVVKKGAYQFNHSELIK
jgi:hypothetical protein